MIALDTNILVRYIMQDDPAQSPRAVKLIESLTPDSAGFVPLICLVELYWVLDHTYKLSTAQISEVLEALLTSDSLIVEDHLRAEMAFHRYQSSNADFDDCLIAEAAFANGCNQIFTLDKKAAKALNMTLLT
ncbi:PIN domain-containing protein [Acidicapsa dinghuensis]|uniref:PIN domain-containing protein n=1 Tax=Acidicapsa dinghuensis TaxID=2218256 RepID=A0ABW1EEV7_9BACT|nr:type II toxin-antitoxin system VapC family toxin [Acidicapsa dinghuensis]